MKRERGISEHEEKSKLFLDSFNEDEEVILSIGGKKYYTSRSTLLSQKSSIFYALIHSGKWKSNKNDEYFFDRDPLYFDIILNILRGNKLNWDSFPSAKFLKGFLKEMKFWQMSFGFKIQNIPDTAKHLNYWSSPVFLQPWLNNSFLIVCKNGFQQVRIIEDVVFMERASKQCVCFGQQTNMKEFLGFILLWRKDERAQIDYFLDTKARGIPLNTLLTNTLEKDKHIEMSEFMRYENDRIYNLQTREVKWLGSIEKVFEDNHMEEVTVHGKCFLSDGLLLTLTSLGHFYDRSSLNLNFINILDSKIRKTISFELPVFQFKDKASIDQVGKDLFHVYVEYQQNRFFNTDTKEIIVLPTREMVIDKEILTNGNFRLYYHRTVHQYDPTGKSCKTIYTGDDVINPTRIWNHPGMFMCVNKKLDQYFFQLFDTDGDIMYEEKFPSPIILRHFYQNPNIILLASENYVHVYNVDDLKNVTTIQASKTIKDLCIVGDSSKYTVITMHRTGCCIWPLSK